jgi:hypothetical protein
MADRLQFRLAHFTDFECVENVPQSLMKKVQFLSYFVVAF